MFLHHVKNIEHNISKISILAWSLSLFSFDDTVYKNSKNENVPVNNQLSITNNL